MVQFPQDGRERSFPRCLVLPVVKYSWSLALTLNQLQTQGKSLALASKTPALLGKAGPEHGLALQACLFAGEQTCTGKSLWEHLGSFKQDKSTARRRDVGMRRETFHQLRLSKKIGV